MSEYSPLLTDQYQLVMAYSYWSLGMADREAVFHLSFRKSPKFSPYIIAAGLQKVIEYIEQFKFEEADIAYLKQLPGETGPLFSEDFLEYLQQLKLTINLDAIPEGRITFPQEPILRVTGPLLQCQLLETALMNFTNFASLIATKASQVYLAAQGDKIIEFGLRRAQGPDGGITASRSAYLGGCQGTSNVLAGKLYSIPIYGTQAHSWIMAFLSEQEAFACFAQVMQSNTALLVDTYETIQGIQHAIEVGLALKKKGQHLIAIRLDSGDLLQLSQQARSLLNQAGLTETQIMASGDLDENRIKELKKNNAPIDIWGVGTRLVTAYEQPALNAIYKLTAIKDKHGQWQDKMKLSNDPQKTTIPGFKQVTRFYKNHLPIQDIIWDEHLGTEHDNRLAYDTCENLLQPIFKDGTCIYSSPPLEVIREAVIQQTAQFNQIAEPYPVLIDSKLQRKINDLTKKIRTDLGDIPT